MVWECVEKLNKVGERRKVQLIWVPRYTGMEENEIADELVKQGASVSLAELEPFLPLRPH